ncbi:hypothetical protein G4228_004445, partial [Cervus hanglu yarkandensis]
PVPPASPDRFSPQLGRYSALFLGMAYGAKRYNYLKPRAEEERRLAAEEKKKRDEQKRIERELAEGAHAAGSPRFVPRPALGFQKQLLLHTEKKGRLLRFHWPLGHPLRGGLGVGKESPCGAWVLTCL